MLAASDSAWDRTWHMPLWNEYQEALKSNFADFPNVASHAGDAVSAVESGHAHDGQPRA